MATSLRNRPASPRLESLEDRVVLTGSILTKLGVNLSAQVKISSTHDKDHTADCGQSHKQQSGSLVKALTKLFVGNNCGCAVNKPPVAVADQATTLTGKAVSINVLTNDKDPEGGPLTVTFVSGVKNGTVTLDPSKPGVLQYTPKAGFTGEECFTYTIADNGKKTASATVKVKVEAPPTTPAQTNRPPTAIDDKITAHAGKTMWYNVLANDKDLDGDTLTLVSVTQGTKGSVRIDSGKAVYTPSSAFVGSDKFTYTVKDSRGATATANVVIEFNNRPPVAVADCVSTLTNQPMTIMVLGNDSDPDGDPLTVTNFVATTASGGTVKRDPANANRLIYTPPKDVVGEDCFTYTVSDGLGGTATTKVSVLVAAPLCRLPPPK